MRSIQLFLLFGMPVLSVFIAFMASRDLRTPGAFASGAMVATASLALATVLLTPSVVEAGRVPLWSWLIVAGAGALSPVLAGIAIIRMNRGWMRRGLFLAAAVLLAGLAFARLESGIAPFVVLVAWAIYGTIAVSNPPLRPSEAPTSGVGA